MQCVKSTRAVQLWIHWGRPHTTKSSCYTLLPLNELQTLPTDVFKLHGTSVNTNICEEYVNLCQTLRSI